MKNYLLTKIRLTYYFYIFFIAYFLSTFFIPHIELSGTALTLFSVNSFLYGFYISPILSAQKSRIEDLHRIVRAEANAMFSLMIHFKKLPVELRTELQTQVTKYIKTKLKHKSSSGGEAEYESLITYCLDYKGTDVDQVNKTLDSLVTNQINRTNFTMQMSNKVYSNEWMVMFILFSITLGFILVIDLGDSLILNIIRALLCTGLTMLIIILVKLSTLTHKKARQMWQPFENELKTHFYRID